jgi:hypothetical protein
VFALFSKHFRILHCKYLDFLLRSMMIRFGLTAEHSELSNNKDHPAKESDRGRESISFFRPLDIAGARRLQLSTERLQELSVNVISQRRRHNSVHETTAASLSLSAQKKEATASLGFETLIHNDHLGADGESRSMKRKPNLQSMSVSTKSPLKADMK